VRAIGEVAPGGRDHGNGVPRRTPPRTSRAPPPERGGALPVEESNELAEAKKTKQGQYDNHNEDDPEDRQIGPPFSVLREIPAALIANRVRAPRMQYLC
jgi:hypothetical protein